jgi:hypothetical protein
VLIAIVAALVQGGSLRHFATLPIRGGGLLMASFAIQLLLYVPVVRDSAVVLHWAGAIYIGALALALLGALRNWHLGVAARLATLGLALNATVIVLNGGHMPVNAAAMRAVQGEMKVREIANQHLYGNTRLAGPSSRLTVLSDVIPVVVPGRRGNVYSVGDVLLAVGVAALAYQATRRPSSNPPPVDPAPRVQE